MKQMMVLSALSLVTLISTTSPAWSAANSGTPLVVSKDSVTLAGEIPSGTKFEALAVYVPAYKYDKSQSSAGCAFAEDQFRPTGSDKIEKFTAVQTGTQYTLSIASAATRGVCNYMLDTVYLTIDNGKLYETFNLRNQVVIDAVNKSFAEIDVEATNSPDLSTLKEMACQFDEDIGICKNSLDESDIELEYGIKTSVKNYSLDIKNFQE